MTFQTDGEEDFIMIGEIFLCVGLQTQPHLHILFHNLKSQPNRSWAYGTWKYYRTLISNANITTFIWDYVIQRFQKRSVVGQINPKKKTFFHVKGLNLI